MRRSPLLFQPAAFLATSLLLTTSLAAAAPQSITWRLADAKGKPLEDAVVSLHPLDRASEAPTPGPSPEIVQVDRIFVPYVTAITVGTSVVFPNRDNVQHHVYSLSKTKRFEIPLYGKEAPREIVFDQPGIVPLGCNIHDWMQCYIVVLDTSLFAKTDGDGMARIADVPAGRYRADIWHPRLAAIVSTELVVAEDAAPAEQRPVLKLRPDRRVREAPAPSTYP
jgi:plastocyanin